MWGGGADMDSPSYHIWDRIEVSYLLGKIMHLSAKALCKLSDVADTAACLLDQIKYYEFKMHGSSLTNEMLQGKY